MRRLRAFFLRLAGLFGRQRRERQLAEELAAHLALHTEDNLRAGMAACEARRQALLKFGGMEAAKEAWRDRSRLPWLTALAQDLRYAGRALRRNRGFSLVAVATLALGIGASTAMFSVVQAVLLRPLPYFRPDRLVEISETNPLKRWTHTVAAAANFADWQRMNTVFTGIAAYNGTDAKGASRYDLFLSGAGEPQRLKGLAVTGNLFDVLGVPPLLGRTFTNEETFEGKDRVAVLSYGLWQTVFAGDPGVVGRTISLTGKNYTVAGVMPRGFFFPSHDVQLFVPFGFKPSVFTEQRRPHTLNVIARLRDGVSLEQAWQQMNAVARRLEQMYPDTNTRMGVRLDNFHATLADEKRPALRMLLAAVGVLFLIVCSNVANLQLGRAAVRLREIGIRQALGADRGRLVRQLLTESLVLAALGGALGLLVAAAARAALLRYAPAAIPLYADLRIDLWVLLFNGAVTVCAPVLFGIVPALTASRPEPLRERNASASRGSRSIRNLLVAGEVALAVVLAAGAGLLIRSLLRLDQVDPGFNPEHAVSFHILLPEVRYPNDERLVRAIQAIDRRLRALPQVRAAGATMRLPLLGYAWSSDATVEGKAGDYERELRHDTITPDYFRAVGTPLLRGRFFSDSDTAGSAAVTLVNETLQKVYFNGRDPVGKRIKFNRPQDKNEWVTIVGVVADEKQDGLDARPQPQAWSPMTQATPNGFTYVLRGTANAEALVAAARRQVHEVDKDLALTDVAPLRELVHASAGDQRFRTSLLSGFAAFALFLAALGVYGVLAYSVVQRSREIGVRLALGAPRARLFGMILRDGLRPVAAGALLGLAAAYVAAGLIRSLLFGVAPLDPPTYLLTVAILAAAALCACAVPAMKAIRADPLVSLREQ